MISAINAELQVSQVGPEKTKFSISADFRHLLTHGFVMPLIIQTPSILCAPPISGKLKTITVMALLDTGASSTCISEIIADELELKPTGYFETNTAAGRAVFPNYTVDILIPNAGLHNYENINVGSCKLPYTQNLLENDRMASTNFGVLIGRDMMTRWNVVWNGPSSSVFISE
ncbi:MAG: retroviral-like aspartic protease family protein [Clostridiales bacterium]|jgi:hypothetical protein|nr:retroviral-like aspartic protease family protein [Clostridiales bacterium]